MEEFIARAVQLFIALTGAYLLALWFALVVWTYRDITSRTANAITQVFSTLIVVLFFVPGAIIYLILRPRETLDDAFQRTMEEEYLLQDLDDFPVCPTCRRSVRDDFVYCPHCRAELRLPCISCHRLVDVRWESCPYCGVTQYEDLAVDSPEESIALGSRSTRSSRAGLFQSIHGGRSREVRPTPADRHPELNWDDQETVPTIQQAPGNDEPAPATGPQPLGSSDEDPSPTARSVRDRG